MNRDLDDKAWLSRARSAGIPRHGVDNLLSALYSSSVAIGRHRRSQDPPIALAA